MSQNTGKEPVAEGSQSVSPSPARHALLATLDATGESTPAVKKKKSWLGSLRDAVQRGALQAKAAVDVFRGEQPKADPKTEAHEPLEFESPSLPSRKSVESIKRSFRSSTTPRHRHHHSLMSKVATASLHQRRSTHSTTGKRSSVYSISDRPSNDMAHLVGPETFDSPSPHDEGYSSQRRKGSVASSFVGSIKGLGRKTGMKKPASPPWKEASPERPAQSVPLPSSPIDIPVVAPALELNLGPSGFMSPTFGRSPEKNQTQELLKLTDPANITSGRPTTASTHMPVESANDRPYSRRVRPRTPKDVLKLHFTHDLNFSSPSYEPSPPSGMLTPMPGTNLNLELDGGNGDEPQVFERSVTPPSEREQKELRTMRSLDAMAEACTIAHGNDEAARPTASSDQEAEVEAASLAKPRATPNLLVQTPRRSAASAETVHSCPSDMPEITRQDSPHEDVDNKEDSTCHFQNSDAGTIRYDPFDDRNAAVSGPPSPTRSVALPFRPKPVVEPAATNVTTDHPITRRREPSDPFRSPNSTVESFGTQSRSERYDIHQEEHSHLEQQTQHHDSPMYAKRIEHVASDDDTHTRAQALLTSDIVLPEYDDLEVSTDGGLSPHGGPLVLNAAEDIDQHHESHSPNIESSVTRAHSNFANAEYRFSINNWLKGSSSAATPDHEPTTPSHRMMDINIDSVSTTEDRTTPQISPSSTNPDRRPSMGNRLEFDLKRSQRNMRYNALEQEKMTPLSRSASDVRHYSPRSIVGGSEETDTQVTRVAPIVSVHQDSIEAPPEASPKEEEKGLQAKVGSEESVPDSLKHAAHDYCQLEERLDESADGEANVFADAAETILYIPSSSTAESDSDGLRKFTPTAPRDNNASIRFKGLLLSELTQTVTPLNYHESNEDYDPLSLVSSSSADIPAPLVTRNAKTRIASTDTLDRSLRLFSSPASGYQAERSSASPEGSATTKTLPARYRSKSKRKAGARPLGEMSKNVV